MNNRFFKPTSLYKEYMILDLIEKNKNITQRDIGSSIGVSLSMVNNYLDNYESDNLITRKRYSKRRVEYFITEKGIERSRLLSLNYLHDTQVLYNAAKHNLKSFILDLRNINICNLVIYGAGEVADIILNMMYSENLLETFSIKIIDDCSNKVGTYLYEVEISPFESLYIYDFDAILLGSYTYRDDMIRKLNDANINKSQIISYFNL